jgi:predicted nucleic acid-binding protein
MSRATSVVYDTGALIAIDSGRNRPAAERHRDWVTHGRKIFVPTVVAAQAVRQPAAQARLMLALSGCTLVPFTTEHHIPVGRLLAKAGTADVVDAFVALLAVAEHAIVVSSDPGDLSRLLDCLGVRRPVLQF